MDADTSRDTALHEAGHAVAAHFLGRGIVAVSIEGDDERHGHVQHRPRPSFWDRVEEAGYAATYGRFIDGTTRRMVEVEIMIALAGGLTQAGFTGDSDPVRIGAGILPLSAEDARAVSERAGAPVEALLAHGSDLKLALDLAEAVSGNGEEAAAYLEWLNTRTASLVLHPWFLAAAGDLADALMQHGTLSGRAARVTIIDALRTHSASEITASQGVFGGNSTALNGH